MLLLWLVREVYTGSVPVIWFRTGLDESFGRKVIKQWDLTVLRWRPSAVYTLEEVGQRTLVQEFSFGSDRLPMFTDLRLGLGGKGAWETFPLLPTPTYPPFDTLLVGWKDCDTHWAKGEAPLAKDGFMLGGSEIIAPLRHMTDEAVRSAIIDHRIPFEPTPDELMLCTECVSTMPLEEFRSRFNLAEEVANGPDIH